MEIRDQPITLRGEQMKTIKIKSGSSGRNVFSRSGFLLLVGLTAFLLPVLPASAQVGEKAKEIGTLAFAGPLALVIMLAVLTLALAGFSMVWRSLFPNRVEWTGEIMRRMPWGSFWFGALTAVILLLVIVILGQGGKGGQFIALLLLIAVALLLGGFCTTSLVDWLGEMIDPASIGMRRTILGSAAYLLLLCIPLLGWALAAGLSMAALGASAVSYFPTRRAAQSPPPVMPVPPQDGPQP
jgi:hypothetical protein